MPDTRQIKVLVVDDSSVCRAVLQHALESDPSIKVVGQCSSGAEAIEELKNTDPDLVTMDIYMPGMDGFDTTRQIMETAPLPVVIVSSRFNPDDAAKAFRTMEAGAVAAIEKPPGSMHPDHSAKVSKLVRTVKAMSEVRVVRRRPRANAEVVEAEVERVSPAPVKKLDGRDIRVVAIGASTGGPPVLRTILSGLPKPFPFPVVIVQHISEGFVEGLAEWLTSTTEMPVHIASSGELVAAGCAYIAPDGFQASLDEQGYFRCHDGPAEHGLKPSVSHLFRSVARNFGKRAVGVLLTGMGRDGGGELKLMRESGAVTIAQDEESSVVFGMPGEAVRLGAAVHIGNPEEIAMMLRSLASSSVV